MKVYKVRHKETGLWSAGGFSPKFTKFGKVWTEKRFLLSHIDQIKSYADQPAKQYDSCRKYLDSIEIVEFDLVEVDFLDELLHGK